MVLGHNINGGNRTQDIKTSRDVTFETMLLNENTLQGLKDSGFYKPSPIQLHGIPLGKCGFDLLLEAKSGTGKTAVFTVIALEKINLNNGLQVLILAPTREIAAQICDVIKQIGSQYSGKVCDTKNPEGFGLTVEVVMGGLPVQEDIEKLKKKVHIIVGSPGRLHHLIKDNYVDTSTVRLLVLDEADKLMEKSFKSDIDFIFSTLPEQKQIIFSSATFPEESKAFINQYVQLHQHICPDSNSVLLGISQRITVVSHNTNIVRQTQHKFEELLNILSKKEFKQCLIFCNYQARVTDLYKMLKRAKWPAEKLYGQQEQTDRLEALKTLQDYKCRILIATDLAARGLDSSHVDLVVNFEPPCEWQTYLHRIGRAGRFGAYGLSVTILSSQEEKQFKELLSCLQFQLDIRNFWSDEQFEYCDFKTPETFEKTESIISSCDEAAETDMYRELWDALTLEPTHEPHEVETFDDLCMSLNDKVETFGDLLESFEKEKAHVVENGDSEVSTKYKCLKPIAVKKLIQHVKNKHSPLEDQALNIKEYKEITVEDEVLPRTQTWMQMESKNGHEQDVTPSNSNNNVEEDKHHHNTKKLNVKKKRKNIAMKKSYNGQEGEASSDESADHGYNTASYDFKKSQCNSANNESVSNTRNNYCYTNEEKTFNGHHSTTHGYTRNYINWYNYLKFRTKQIEMAVYINEMSKLYSKNPK